MNFGSMDLIGISQNLLQAAKADENVSPFIYQLEKFPLKQLFICLDTDD